ncbi:MAG: FapA family protein [Treponema sp.]|uniref:FapA family protein n=1 Tax=Treponema sp. TaxID=166 RepID=UPI003FA2AD4C
MITLDKIRTEMEQLLEAEKNLRYVEVRADSLEEALADAAAQLETRPILLEYEVLEQGFNGFVGLMKKPWFIRAYQNAASLKNTAKKKKGEDILTGALEDDGKPKDVNGLFFVRHFGSQINLKVIPPVGKGVPVSIDDVMLQLKRSDTLSIEEDVVKKTVEKGSDGEYIPVGLYSHNQAGDASFYVDISADEMKAYIVATAPAVGGAEISSDRILRMLDSQRVVAGINKEFIDTFVDTPVYDTPFLVAEAPAPVDGRDAYIAYNFETDRSKLRIKETESGQVDFKELNLIQNVIEGQPLAQKIPPERGKGGKTLFGRYLEAKNGKDIHIPMGKNVTLDADGRTVLAAANGQVLLVNDKITVEPVMELDAVNIKTGNITFLGTVIVKGNVEDGFDVHASGNIEVHGSVGSSRLEADNGDIVVSQGIMGKDKGFLKAGKSLWAKFIQNATVEAEEFIIVHDGIINSNVTANKKVLVQGKRASIIGGHTFATEEIHAKNIGNSTGGSETILEVGFDPKAKKRNDELIESQEKLTKELDEIELNIQTLQNQKKVRKTLPHDKEESLNALIARQSDIQAEMDEITSEIQELQAYLRELKVVGKVSASGMVYAGVKIFIRDVKEEVRTETKAVTFFYENGFVRYGKYEPPSEEDAKRSPDGYSTN